MHFRCRVLLNPPLRGQAVRPIIIPTLQTRKLRPGGVTCPSSATTTRRGSPGLNPGIRVQSLQPLHCLCVAPETLPCFTPLRPALSQWGDPGVEQRATGCWVAGMREVG